MKVLHGTPAAPGLSIGSAFLVRPASEVDLNARSAQETPAEIARLEHAIEQAGASLEQLQATAEGPLSEILAAQREMLDDPELKAEASTLIGEGYSAEAAITRVASNHARQLAELENDYMAARSEDVHEVGRRIVAALRGQGFRLDLTQPSIIVAQDLSPADLVALDVSRVLGIVIEGGSASGHLAIVAQSLGVPAVVGASNALTEIATGSRVIVDGEQGLVTSEPGAQECAEVEKRLFEKERARQRLEFYRQRPGLTADGQHIEVFANIGSLVEAEKALEQGAEGVGLLRTELMALHGLPTEDEQFECYEEIAAALQRPLVIRTFDIGGDKPVPGLDIPSEANPFLGWRGIRLGLDRPAEVFLPQIRALLRAAMYHDIRIMLPMITTPQEVQQARALIDQAIEELQIDGYKIHPIPLGIMVETPAAALTLDQFVGLIDFASIGTNDLVQYTYAVDRTNAQVRTRAHPLGLATLRLIAQICQTGIPIAVCGQMAADPTAIPLLVGLGVRELSVPPMQISATKHVLASMTLSEMQRRARLALEHRQDRTSNELARSSG